MPEPNSNHCRVCNTILPVRMTGKGRMYCSPSCYKQATDARTKLRHSMGLCKCGRPAVEGIKACELCRSNSKIRSKRVQLGYARDQKCANCAKPREEGRRLCTRCKNNLRERGIRGRRELKLRVIAAYGNICVCCGENHPTLLTVDHIDESGAAHRRELGFTVSYYMYRYLIKHNFPKSNYQLLCYNCNIGKHINKGRCPHEDIRRANISLVA